MVYDVIVVGAGIVGLATARQLLLSSPHLKVLVLEKEEGPAFHQSGHNSGVIHSGVYYRPGSLKAKTCLRGYDLLKNFLDAQHIPYELPGKLIVATNRGQVSRLEAIHNTGVAKGLKGLEIWDSAELREKEPFVAGVKALYVPQTGIVDFQKVSVHLLDHFQELGGETRFSEELIDVVESSHGVRLMTAKGEGYTAKLWVNCCGLHSDEVAEMLGQKLPIHIVPFRGEYYEIASSWLKKLSHLIYPVPNPDYPFLGVHITKTMRGNLEAGPNAVLALAREGYSWGDFDLQDFLATVSWPGFKKFATKHWRMGLMEFKRSFSRAEFLKSLQELVPALRDQDLSPGPSGVRAQAMDEKGHLLDDFFLFKTGRGLQVLNAPSPAATSSLAIAEHIVNELGLG